MTADDSDIAAMPPGADPVLIARMTGRLGDARTIQRKASDLAAALCAPLEAVLDESAGLSVSIEHDTVELGTRSKLQPASGTRTLYAPCAIQGWCPEFTIATSTTLAVAFVENLLGGGQDTVTDRPLTPVERDVSILFFEKVLSVFCETAGASEGKATVGAPEMPVPDEEDERPDVHCVSIGLTVSLEGMSAPISILLPQTAVMKVKVVAPSERTEDTPEPAAEWIERLTRQVSRSDVVLQAQIPLDSLTLGTISRLQPGDILPFADIGEVNVQLEANGRAFGMCELGRSGSRYMLRLKAAENFEDELVRDMMQ